MGGEMGDTCHDNTQHTVFNVAANGRGGFDFQRFQKGWLTERCAGLEPVNCGQAHFQQQGGMEQSLAADGMIRNPFFLGME